MRLAMLRVMGLMKKGAGASRMSEGKGDGLLVVVFFKQ